MDLASQLIEIAELSRGGAQERVLETEIVQVFKQVGWPRLQISQDVSISDKAADKVDVMLHIENQPVMIAEIKRFGYINEGESQLRRYCNLMRPIPRFAVLTDGIDWRFYYVGTNRMILIYSEVTTHDATHSTCLLTLFNPERLKNMVECKTFEYASLIDHALEGLSEHAGNEIRPHFASTIRALLHLDTANPTHLPVQNVISALPPVVKQPHPQLHATVKIADSPGANVNEYDVANPPTLKYTTCQARFRQETVNSWDKLVHTAIQVAVHAGHTLTDLQKHVGLNMKVGIHNTKEGFKHVAGTNLSVQGMEANRAWPAAWKLAMLTQSEIEVHFEWRDKEQVLLEHRGKQGILRWSPGK